MQDDPEFASNYARAKERFAEREFSQLLDIADTANAENANAVRLQIDTRKWVLSKLLPKKFGERPAETHVTTNVINSIPVERQKQWQERMKKVQRNG